MNFKLLVLIIIVLGIVAVAQLVRLYEMSSKLSNKREEDIPARDNKLNANLMLVFMAAFYIGFIWLMMKYGWTGRGPSASYEGIGTDKLLNLNFVITIAAFFLTNTLLFVFAWKYVAKPGVKAYFFSHSNKLEIVWTIIPAIVLTVIIVLGLKEWNTITDAAPKQAKVIELYSKQFDWTARYAGANNKLGYFDYKLTTANNELGLLSKATIDSAINNMENGADGIYANEKKLNDKNLIFLPEDKEKMENKLRRDQRMIRLLYQMKARHSEKLDDLLYDDVIMKDTLYLAVNQLYEFNFRAKDVIHSAYFPHFRAQMNTVPGMTTRFKFTPRYTTEKMRTEMNNSKFNYVLMCNKICGGAHYKMKMMVVVLGQKEHAAWMKSKSTFRDTYFPKIEKAPVATTKADSTIVAKVN
jgi:cytochrome c oxidase subunit II